MTTSRGSSGIRTGRTIWENNTRAASWTTAKTFCLRPNLPWTKRSPLAAVCAASGDLGEIDLERYQGKLAFNIEIGGKDVKVDAGDGSIVGVDSDD